MPNRSEAYDFSLFEDHTAAAAPARLPRRDQPESAPRENVVELPRRELEKNAKPRRHPIRAMASVTCFIVFLAIAVAMVYSQQQLAVLTEQINAASQSLEQKESLEVQLSMQAAQKMSGTQVENYAAGKLGMGKATSSQVTYVNVAQKDQGMVIQSTEGGSWLDKLLSTVRSLFAED